MRIAQTYTPAECNYDIYNKAVKAIAKVLEEWRPEFEGGAHMLKLHTDHQNHEYFVKTQLLHSRYARWYKLLSRCDDQTLYIPAKSNGKGDALTRRPPQLPEGGMRDSKQWNR